MLVQEMEAHSMVLDNSPLLWTPLMLVSYLLDTSVSYYRNKLTLGGT